MSGTMDHIKAVSTRVIFTSHIIYRKQIQSINPGYLYAD